MKGIIFFCVLFFFLINLQAQRRHTHFRRVKVEKVNVINNTHQRTIVEKEVVTTTPGIQEVTQESKSEVIVNLNNKEDKSIETRTSSRQKKLKESRNVSLGFFQNVLKARVNLAKVEDVKKTNLRTWKWLVIASSILIAIGIVLLILVSNLSHPAASFALAFGIGCVVVGVILLIIFLILGLSGRI